MFQTSQSNSRGNSPIVITISYTRWVLVLCSSYNCRSDEYDRQQKKHVLNNHNCSLELIMVVAGLGTDNHRKHLLVILHVQFLSNLFSNFLQITYISIHSIIHSFIFLQEVFRTARAWRGSSKHDFPIRRGNKIPYYTVHMCNRQWQWHCLQMNLI